MFWTIRLFINQKKESTKSSHDATVGRGHYPFDDEEDFSFKFFNFKACFRRICSCFCEKNQHVFILNENIYIF